MIDLVGLLLFGFFIVTIIPEMLIESYIYVPIYRKLRTVYNKRKLRKLGYVCIINVGDDYAYREWYFNPKTNRLAWCDEDKMCYSLDMDDFYNPWLGEFLCKYVFDSALEDL